MRIETEYFTLSNGLRVVLHRNDATPLVCVNIAYNVGSKDEAPGKTGFAHLFEHLMFDGSVNIPRGMYDRYCEQAGGYNNAYTSEDKTNYYIVLPSNQLALGLWLESDRLLQLGLTAEGLETQRNVVMEEKRQHVDNQPYGTWDTKISELLYGNHPYGHPVIGSMEDIAAASMTDVVSFHKSFYQPNNAALCIAGDFDRTEARTLIEKYFEPIEAGTLPRRLDGNFSRPNAESREIVQDNVPLPAVFMAYAIDAERHDNFVAADLLTDVLGNGESSRLHHKLVYEQQIACQASAYVDAREYEGVLSIYAVANEGRTAEELETAIDAELSLLVTNGVSTIEMEKTLNRLQTSHYQHMQSIAARAERLSHFALFYDDPTMIHSMFDRYLLTTGETLHAMAHTLFSHRERVVLHYIPTSSSMEMMNLETTEFSL